MLMEEVFHMPNFLRGKSFFLFILMGLYCYVSSIFEAFIIYVIRAYVPVQSTLFVSLLLTPWSNSVIYLFIYLFVLIN